ncbi:hypothetical protein C5167_025665 [Papaver somniferum]|uniref:Uncharacterized protein n=1 Tax=Papaver somniferum TaxID=3469 RepID=A0A4Y7JVC4_PAPSO|nr:hypothetical protein C5167_025665 [Papaver somniferum]
MKAPIRIHMLDLGTQAFCSIGNQALRVRQDKTEGTTPKVSSL